jgi:ABC-type glycerol-3-phosphate transport system permease component
MVQGMKYAIIFVACLPLLVAYPFVQKYFTKGMMIGAVKG